MYRRVPEGYNEIMRAAKAKLFDQLDVLFKAEFGDRLTINKPDDTNYVWRRYVVDAGKNGDHEVSFCPDIKEWGNGDKILQVSLDDFKVRTKKSDGSIDLMPFVKVAREKVEGIYRNRQVRDKVAKDKELSKNLLKEAGLEIKYSSHFESGLIVGVTDQGGIKVETTFYAEKAKSFTPEKLKQLLDLIREMHGS